MTDRAVSTVLDVSVFLLLVGAAVLTLLSAPTAAPDPAADRADEVATTLSGSTATINYTEDGETRTAHGTLAGLLADAAVAAVRPQSAGAFRDAVGNATGPALGGRGWHGNVLVTWRPHGEADPDGTVRVGPDPPPDGDVYAATLTVPSGLAPRRAEARAAAAGNGYRGVAGAIATSHPGVDAGPPADRRLATELEATYDSPAAAARAVSVGRVTVTVRTWSP